MTVAMGARGEHRTYVWSYFLSWGLTISGGALAVVSVLAYFLPDTIIKPDAARLLCVIAFAAMVGFSVACANCTAAAAQHAISRQGHFYAATFWPAIACTLGFCVTTGIGVHLGWVLMTQGIASHDLPDARLVNGAAVFIALAKPGMNWIIEGRKAIDKDERAEAEAKEDARVKAEAEARRAETEARAGNVTQLRPKSKRVTAGAAALASLTLMGSPHGAAEAVPQTQSDAPRQTQLDASASPVEKHLATALPPPQTHRKRASRRATPDYETRVAYAKELLLTQPSLSNREVARRAEVSASTADRLARELTPLSNTAAQGNAPAF